MRIRSLFIALVLVLTTFLVACGTPPAVEAPDFDAVLTDVSGTNNLFGVATLLIDVASLGPISTTADALASADAPSLSTAAFVDAGDGLFVGDLVAATDGDTVPLFLPAPADLPASSLAPVEDAFPNATAAADCSVSATPSSASVTGIAFEGFGFPGFFALGVNGLQETVASESVLNLGTFPDEGDAVLSWAYADTAVVVDFTGTDCEGFVVQDLSLEQGWNTLQWTLTNVADPTPTITLAVIAQPDGFNLYVD